MLFKPELCQLILHGLKTQTRRLVQPGDTTAREIPLERDAQHFLRAGRERIVEVQRHNRLRWAVDRTYAVCPGRGRAQVGRIRITQLRQERLQDISLDDRAAEGCFDVAPVGGGVHITGPGPRAFPELWDAINDRHGTRWADNPLVWVLTFEVVQ